MKEIHGLAGVRKVALGTGATQSVAVEDADEGVRLSLASSSFPAELTPQEARYVAAQLIASADRVDAAAGRAAQGAA